MCYVFWGSLVNVRVPVLTEFGCRLPAGHQLQTDETAWELSHQKVWLEFDSLRAIESCCKSDM